MPRCTVPVLVLLSCIALAASETSAVANPWEQHRGNCDTGVFSDPEAAPLSELTRCVKLLAVYRLDIFDIEGDYRKRVIAALLRVSEGEDESTASTARYFLQRLASQDPAPAGLPPTTIETPQTPAPAVDGRDRLAGASNMSQIDAAWKSMDDEERQRLPHAERTRAELVSDILELDEASRNAAPALCNTSAYDIDEAERGYWEARARGASAAIEFLERTLSLALPTRSNNKIVTAIVKTTAPVTARLVAFYTDLDAKSELSDAHFYIHSPELACGPVTRAVLFAAFDRHVKRLRGPERLRAAERRCEIGDGAECERIGSLAADSAQHGPDLPRAARFLESGCKWADAKSCFGLGSIQSRLPGYFSSTKQQESQARAYVRGCLLGYGPACDRAAASDQNVELWGIFHKYHQIFDDLPARCARGDGSACVPLANRAENGLGRPKDLAEAEALLVRGCRGGDAVACSWLAMRVAERTGVERGTGEPLRLWEKSRDIAYRRCLQKKYDLCSMALANYADGLLPGNRFRDVTRAGEIGRVYHARLNERCRLGYAYDCYALGQVNAQVAFYRSEHGVTVAADEVASAFSRSCQLGFPRACEDLARYLETGEHLQKNTRQAAILYRKACDMGWSTACPEAKRLGQ